MTQVLPRTNFHSSKLIRCLADLALAEAAEPENAFAEKLGQWIHFTDAISLAAVHDGGVARASKRQPEARSATWAACSAEFDRKQAILTHSITASCSPAGKAIIKLPEPVFDLPVDLAAAYAPYHRFYEAHQRDMEASVQSLRNHVRGALAEASPRLKTLAELDATFEKILDARADKLLPKVPVLLKKRFNQLFNEHQRELADTQQTDNPDRWMQTGGWLARFCNDMQTLLLAELEFRLQPAMGLIEAFKQDTQ